MKPQKYQGLTSILQGKIPACPLHFSIRSYFPLFFVLYWVELCILHLTMPFLINDRTLPSQQEVRCKYVRNASEESYRSDLRETESWHATSTDLWSLSKTLSFFVRLHVTITTFCHFLKRWKWELYHSVNWYSGIESDIKCTVQNMSNSARLRTTGGDPGVVGAASCRCVQKSFKHPESPCSTGPNP